MNVKIVLTGLFFLTQLLQTAFAQVPGDEGVCDTCPVPVDEWLLILLAAGAAYGFVKHKREQKVSTR